uniref:Uncharacterized protein n=1 Tax=viral metagenome TaxID=1070528 RepID=A0A6C0IS76_9ZZZZ
MDTINSDNILFLTNDNLLVDNNEDIDINNLLNEFLHNDNIEFTDSIWNTNKDYTIKELLKICKYYGIDKNVKGNKCKKQEIIDTIIFFENVPENFEIVFQRNKMWTYMNELKNDIHMKQYILWD